MPRGAAGRRQAMRISARLHVLSDRKFCGREIFSKFSVRIAPKNVRNPARRGMPMIFRHIADLFASWRGRASSTNADFGAVGALSRQKVKSWSHQRIPGTLQKRCFDPSQGMHFLTIPPPPRAMLKSNTRERANGTECDFSTLRGGAGGGKRMGGSISLFFIRKNMISKHTFLR